VPILEGEQTISKTFHVYQKTWETHAIIPDLDFFRIREGERGIDNEQRLVDVHVKDALLDANLRGGDGAAGMVQTAVFHQGVVQVGFKLGQEGRFLWQDRCTDLVKLRVAKE